MISEPIVVQVLQGPNVIDKYREIMGSTNPESAKEGTIRKICTKYSRKLCSWIRSSEMHQEINYFFNESEIFE